MIFDKREAVATGSFNVNELDVGVKPVWGSWSRLRIIKLGEIELE
jgi:hypothetical protein